MTNATALLRRIPFALTKADAGSFEGYAAVFDNVDRQGDKIARGAFAGTLARFLEDGVIGWQHDVSEPIGYPLEVREDGRGLYLRAAFQSSPAAQQVRSIILERDRAGKGFGLSIGYLVRPGGSYQDGDTRVLTDLDLLEVSLVSVPANDLATVTGVKCSGCAPAPVDPQALLVLAEANATRLHLEMQSAGARRDVEAKLASIRRPASYSYAFVDPGAVCESKRTAAATAAGLAAHELDLGRPVVRFFRPAAGAGDFRAAKDVVGHAVGDRHEAWVDVARLEAQEVAVTIAHEVMHLTAPGVSEADAEGYAQDLVTRMTRVGFFAGAA